MFRRSILRLSIISLLLVGLASSVEAKVKLPSIISDNMVLQAGRPANIWGWAEPGEEVTVAMAGPTRDLGIGKGYVVATVELKANADAKGRWQVTLRALEAPGREKVMGVPAESGHWDTMTITDSSGEKTVIKNILVGEVWLCSGQSNMEWPVVRSNDAEKEIAEAKYPTIRFFQIKNRTADKPRTDCEGQWVECSPETVGHHTAIGYFFGRELLKTLDTPVGLIQSDWGGTPAEAWTSREALEAQPSLEPLLERWDESAEKNTKMARSAHRPANLYNGMIAPITPYAIRGAIWYQGESNVGRAYQYRTIFPTMIANWRERFGLPEMPFGFVQIAPFKYTRRPNQGNPQFCAELWEAQRLTLLATSGTGMVVTTDIGNVADIHPTNKQDVGHRLALWALATVYGKDNVVYSGPMYKSMTVEGDKIRLSFDHVGGGLVARDDKPLSHFVIAGEDKVFHPATAQIDGETIVVSSDAVPKPVAVRFAPEETAEPNLMNREGLPASPFRTDAWPWETQGNH
ncbi:MAG: sialate O-acetylesterase [Pirellulaceae bacterium]|nr:sialate O-acetylesterase [Pirellulaceae bacterium]